MSNGYASPADEREDLEKTVACLKRVGERFRAMADRRWESAAQIELISEQIRRMSARGGSSGAISQRGGGNAALDARIKGWEESVVTRRAARKKLCQSVSDFAQKVAAWTKDLERREQGKELGLSSSPSVPISTGANGLMPDEFGRFAQPEGGFPQFVILKLNALAEILEDRYPSLNRVAQLAVLKFIGEEYSGRGPWDEIQDWLADSGSGRVLLGSRDPITGLPTKDIPDRFRTGNKFEKAMTQLDFMDYDLGIANVNLKSAALLAGAKSPTDIMALAKYLTTDVGTLDYAIRFVLRAQTALNPLIDNMDTETQAQIIVDFVREGPQDFWNREKKLKGLNDEQLNAWRRAPRTYIGPNGTVPPPLKPNPDSFKRAQFDEIEEALGWQPVQ
jgi:hypothetical protein